MSIHDEVEAYALGALEPGEREMFAAHLDACAECRASLESYRPVVEGLQGLTRLAPPPMPSIDRNPRRYQAAITALAAAVALAVGLLGGIRAASADSTQMLAVLEMLPDVSREVRLSGSNASGVILTGVGRKRTAIIIKGLPTPPLGRGYQVWTHGARVRTPGMLHRVGPVEVLITSGDYVDGASSFGVTIEPATGSRSRTGPVVMRGSTV